MLWLLQLTQDEGDRRLLREKIKDYKENEGKKRQRNLTQPYRVLDLHNGVVMKETEGEGKGDEELGKRDE